MGTAVITGGSRGIGRRIAERLAADGRRVVLTYRRREDDAVRVVEGIRQAGGSACARRVELESDDDLDALIDESADDLDVLVASAAASAFRPVEGFGSHHLERSWATNVRSFVRLAQRARPVLRPGGRIVALTSYGSIRTFPGYGAIGADKAAIESWVRAMAAEFGPAGVTVNAVNAGLVDTDSLRHYYAQPGAPDPESLVDRIPLRRLASPADVAGAVAWLTGPDAAYVTGQSIVVDGGLTIVAPPFAADFRDDPAP